MKKSISHLVGLTAIVLLLASCVEDIDLDTGENLPIVVDCVLKMDTVQTMRLYQMAKLNEDGYKPVDNATVELLKVADNLPVAQFHRKSGILWETRYMPEFGKQYKLSVSIPGKEEIIATTTFPHDMRLVLHTRTLRNGTGIYDNTRDTTYLQMITAEVATAKMVTEKDFLRGGIMHGTPWPDYAVFPLKVYYPTGSKACKMWIYPHRDSMVVFPPKNFVECPWMSFSALPFKPSPKPYCSTVVTDHPYADNFNIVPGSVTDLDIVNVPVNTQAKRMPWPLVHITLINYTQWIPKLCPDLPLHEGFVRIDQPDGFNHGLTDEELKSSHLPSNGSFLILGDYQNYLSGIEPVLIEVRFLSDEYDAFLRDLHIRNLSKDDFILSTYDSNNIYTNIQGGAGVFGAEITTWAQPSHKTFDVFRQ